VSPRVVDEDTPHQLRRDSKKMGAILPLDSGVIDQPHIRFVYERSGV
jgi:hypothetical protein